MNSYVIGLFPIPVYTFYLILLYHVALGMQVSYLASTPGCIDSGRPPVSKAVSCTILDPSHRSEDLASFRFLTALPSIAREWLLWASRGIYCMVAHEHGCIVSR